MTAIPARSTRAVTEPPEFVLDRTENPHPKMLAGAREARSASHASPFAFGFWQGYLAAMCDATGESSEAIAAWMDRNA